VLRDLSSGLREIQHALSLIQALLVDLRPNIDMASPGLEFDCSGRCEAAITVAVEFL
jgi:hypothetical protein